MSWIANSPSQRIPDLVIEPLTKHLPAPHPTVAMSAIERSIHMIKEIGRRAKIEIWVKFVNDQPVLLDCFESNGVRPREEDMRLANRNEEENEGEQTAEGRIFADGFDAVIVRGSGGRGRRYIGICGACAVWLFLIWGRPRHCFDRDAVDYFLR